MTTTSSTAVDLQQLAKEHLWMHFTRMGDFATEDVPIIVRGDGPSSLRGSSRRRGR